MPQSRVKDLLILFGAAASVPIISSIVLIAANDAIGSSDRKGAEEFLAERHEKIASYEGKADNEDCRRDGPLYAPYRDRFKLADGRTVAVCASSVAVCSSFWGKDCKSDFARTLRRQVDVTVPLARPVQPANDSPDIIMPPVQ